MTTATSIPSNPASTAEVSKTLEQSIQDALVQARTACASQGDTSNECAVAWDIVEELQAERSHRKVNSPKHTFASYCEQFPEADECRIYDV